MPALVPGNQYRPCPKTLRKFAVLPWCAVIKDLLVAHHGELWCTFFVPGLDIASCHSKILYRKLTLTCVQETICQLPKQALPVLITQERVTHCQVKVMQMNPHWDGQGGKLFATVHLALCAFRKRLLDRPPFPRLTAVSFKSTRYKCAEAYPTISEKNLDTPEIAWSESDAVIQEVIGSPRLRLANVLCIWDVCGCRWVWSI